MCVKLAWRAKLQEIIKKECSTSALKEDQLAEALKIVFTEVNSGLYDVCSGQAVPNFTVQPLKKIASRLQLKVIIYSSYRPKFSADT
jgi:hypothetical protein